MRIGFIGLGKMGWGMAQWLAQSGHDLFVWNRTLAKAQNFANEHHAKACNSPREVTHASDVIVTMLADPQALAEVTEGGDGILAGAKEGLIWIDSSTVDPSTSREFADKARARGVRFLDAPVAGGPNEAASGRLLIAVGGAREDFESARPLLEQLGDRVFYMGANGSGTQMKLVLNGLLGGFVEVIAEALDLGLKTGLTREQLEHVIGQHGLGTPFVMARIRRLLDEKGPVTFDLALMLKDLDLITQTARHVGATTPALDTTRDEYARANDSGSGNRDYMDIFMLRHRDGEHNG